MGDMIVIQGRGAVGRGSSGSSVPRVPPVTRAPLATKVPSPLRGEGQGEGRRSRHLRQKDRNPIRPEFAPLPDPLPPPEEREEVVAKVAHPEEPVALSVHLNDCGTTT